jgi:hypothetical protein
VTALSSEAVVTRHGTAMAAMDIEALARLRHPDWGVLWPPVLRAPWVERT